MRNKRERKINYTSHSESKICTRRQREKETQTNNKKTRANAETDRRVYTGNDKDRQPQL